MIKKLKVLFVIDWYLPGFKAGGPVRSMINMSEYLAQDLDFYIITSNKEYLENEPYDNVVTGEWNKLSCGENVYYIDPNNVTLKFLRKIIKSENFDCVYIHGIFSWKFSILPIIAAKLNRHKKIIIASRGMLADSAVGVKSFRKRIFLKVAKLVYLYKNIVFHATNEKEQQEIFKNISKKTNVIVAENLPKKNIENFSSINKSKNLLKLISIARIAPEKNTLYALKVLHSLKSLQTNIIFDLYGEIYSDEYWHKCEDVITDLPDNIKVNYCGAIRPELINRTIADYHCMFMPSRGENFGHSILESFMAGRPVLISDQTPWKDLKPKKLGWDLPLNDQNQFDNSIIKLIEVEQDEFDSLCLSSYEFAKKSICNPELILKYKEMLSPIYLIEEVNDMDVSLLNYNNNDYNVGKNKIIAVAWYIINSLVFQSSLIPFSGLKVRLLRLFGAKIGLGVRIKPSVNIKYPWKLEVGDYTWIGEGVWIDNLALVIIGSNACLSQGAMLLTGNHNYKKNTFDLILGEITIEDGVWIGAKALVCPGVKANSHSMLTADSVATKELEAYSIYQGNPAVKIRERIINK